MPYRDFSLQEEDLDENRLEILIDALQNGVNIFKDVEKELAHVSFSTK
jgi:hypothetical protein